MFSDINWIGTLISFIIFQALGTFWYSVAGFGKPWMKAIGITPEKIKAGEGGSPAKAMIITILSSLAFVILFSIILSALKVTPITGVLYGFIFGLIVSLVFATNHAFENRPWIIFWINISYRILAFTLSGLALGVKFLG